MFQIQLTDFHKVFEDEVSKFRANPNSDPKSNPLVRQFKEAVWVCFFSLATVEVFFFFLGVRLLYTWKYQFCLLLLFVFLLSAQWTSLFS